METVSQSPTSANEKATASSPSRQLTADGDFAPGTQVIYPMHGKCNVVAVESRQVQGQTLRFYRLEVVRSTLSRSAKPEPAIWVPVQSAQERGIRFPISADEAAATLAILTSREYYFSLNDSFHALQPKLEAAIRREGSIGLAKVFSYLYVLTKKQLVPPSEVIRYQDSVSKLLFRELSEALNEPIRAIEEKIARGLRQKLLPDL